MGGPPKSRARSAVTAARFPPALSPATTIGRPRPSPPGDAAHVSA